jgi:glycosyltransferase involved in cell wall biosynthesis
MEEKKEFKPYYKRRFYNRYRKEKSNVNAGFSFRKISIVVPLFNEEESLKPLSSLIKKSCGQMNLDFEVYFIDDGSTDKSLSTIKEIHHEDKRFKYISFQKNFGKSAALQIGFKHAQGDVVITMDADLQDDPEEIPNLLKKLEEGFDLVSGWKKKRYDPFIKKFSSRFFNFVTSMMTGIKLHDFNCGLKAYRRNVVENIKVYGELHRYMPVLAKWQGYRVTEIPVLHHPRKFGKTKFGVSRFFKGFVDLLTVVFITRYVKRPMHLFGFIGAIFSLSGLIINSILSFEWMVYKQPLSNRPMLFLGILLIIVGIQFFSTGLIGEMMVHNFQNDKEYCIKDKMI